MAENAQNHINYYLKIEEIYKSYLSDLRSWENLKVGIDKGTIWLTNFTQEQIESLEVKTVSSKTIYYSKENKLYLFGSLLPVTKEPTLLWTPIQRAFTLESPAFNHNYFGVKEKIKIEIVKTELEKEPFALLTSLERLVKYAEKAPSYRLNKLKWLLIDEDLVLLIGTPFLPLEGEVYWKHEQALLPVGYNFELSVLASNLLEKIDVTNEYWVVWSKDSSFFKVQKEQFKSLSLSSIRKTSIHLDNMDKLLKDVY